MRYTRIEMNGNETRLVYQRGLILEFSSVIKKPRHGWHSALELAYAQLKSNIGEARRVLREKDKLADKSNGAILNLLRRKREHKASLAFESKSPQSKAKHVGVEIEFISNSTRKDIAKTLAFYGVTDFVELKSDSSVHSGSTGDDCDGSCREDCSCYDCGEPHYCDEQRECARRDRNYGSDHNGASWEIRENCEDCTDTEYLDGCDCGGNEPNGDNVCNGEHVVCSGHCLGHQCAGVDDHDNWDCNCECTCSVDDGHEIAIVTSSNKIAEIVTKVCKALAEHNAEVNKTCGLHVHLDMRNADEKRAFSNLVKSQNLLYSMVPASRYRNSYCAPNSSRDMTKYHSRYWGINPKSFTEHKTIEIRLHSGSVNAVKIINWIKLLQKIAYTKQKLPLKAKSVSAITSKLNLSSELIEYINERINKFDNPLLINDLNKPAEQLELLAA